MTRYGSPEVAAKEENETPTKSALTTGTTRADLAKEIRHNSFAAVLRIRIWVNSHLWWDLDQNFKLVRYAKVLFDIIGKTSRYPF